MDIKLKLLWKRQQRHDTIEIQQQFPYCQSIEIIVSGVIKKVKPFTETNKTKPHHIFLRTQQHILAKITFLFGWGTCKCNKSNPTLFSHDLDHAHRNPYKGTHFVDTRKRTTITRRKYKHIVQKERLCSYWILV